MKIYTVAISNDFECLTHGVKWNFAEAVQVVYNYVKSYWDEVEGRTIEHPDLLPQVKSKEVPEDIPTDHALAIKLYFWHHPECERYDIQAFELKDGEWAETQTESLD